jgi:hypothetical protein
MCTIFLPDDFQRTELFFSCILNHYMFYSHQKLYLSIIVYFPIRCDHNEMCSTSSMCKEDSFSSSCHIFNIGTLIKDVWDHTKCSCNVESHTICFCCVLSHTEYFSCTHGTFVLALKWAVLHSGYMAEFSPGRPPCSAGVVMMKIAGLT